MKDCIKEWWQNSVVASWNWRKTLEEKDKELIATRQKVHELGSLLQKRDDDILEYQRDIIQAAEKFTQEREEHEQEVFQLNLKIALISRKTKTETKVDGE